MRDKSSKELKRNRKRATPTLSSETRCEGRNLSTEISYVGRRLKYKIGLEIDLSKSLQTSYKGKYRD